MGRLTRDPEIRYSQSGLPIANFTLAVDRRFNRQGEERQADFIPIVAFGKTAEFCEKYYRKGQQVLIVGRIQTRTWDDNEGKRRYITEVICEEAHFADSKRQDAGARPDDFSYIPGDGQDGAYGSGGGSAFGGNSPFGPGANAYGGAPQRQAGDNDRLPGRANGDVVPFPGGQDGDRRDSGDNDGFMPVESESDLPF